MEIVLKPAVEGFAPRTRTATSERLTALKPTLVQVEAATPGTFTIVEKLSPKESASLVALLNAHYSKDWTFAARSTDDGTAIVQAKFDPANRRPVRKIDPAKLAARREKAAAKKAGKTSKK